MCVVLHTGVPADVHAASDAFKCADGKTPEVFVRLFRSFPRLRGTV